MAKEEGMHFVRVIPLTQEGVVEFSAWEKAKWIGIWERPYNVKSTKPHLIFEDCPGARQITYRMLILHGQAQLPMDEKWMPIPVWWQTRKSFGTLWLNASAQKKTAEPERGKTPATMVEPDQLVEVPDAENVVVYSK